MKKITDIYTEYKIMQLLQLHQLRVAAVALQICDSLNIKIDTDNIVKACLLHDMGNIIKFKLEHYTEWNKPEGTDYWQAVKYDYILKYGNDEHQASLKIADELGVSNDIKTLVNCVDSSSVEMINLENDFGQKICLYSDNRVSPYGVVSVEEHSLDAKERYKNHPHAFNEDKRLFFNENLISIEKQIFSHSKIKPEDVNDSNISEYFEKVKKTLI